MLVRAPSSLLRNDKPSPLIQYSTLDFSFGSMQDFSLLIPFRYVVFLRTKSTLSRLCSNNVLFRPSLRTFPEHCHLVLTLLTLCIAFYYCGQLVTWIATIAFATSSLGVPKNWVNIIDIPCIEGVLRCTRSVNVHAVMELMSF